MAVLFTKNVFSMLYSLFLDAASEKQEVPHWGHI